MLSRVFRPKRDQVTEGGGGCGKDYIRLHKEALDDLYCSVNIIRVIKWRRMRLAGHVVCMGRRRGVYRVLVGKPEGNRPVGRTRHRWEDNIKTDLKEMRGGCGLN